MTRNRSTKLDHPRDAPLFAGLIAFFSPLIAPSERAAWCHHGGLVATVDRPDEINMAFGVFGRNDELVERSALLFSIGAAGWMAQGPQIVDYDESTFESSTTAGSPLVWKTIAESTQTPFPFPSLRGPLSKEGTTPVLRSLSRVRARDGSRLQMGSTELRELVYRHCCSRF